ncbi:MAG TPA: AAA family ATPase [Gaiellales bacterium]|nr:AAA family ATPase [Gaiellales bacterium]
MIACPDCGMENPEGFAFCGFCASPLTVHARTPAREERKVVTSLFCDLVGFTASSAVADPEDVDRMLARYFDAARRQIEAYGGVVEKFIGDAVVGVFGVPAAHEDDPERAVRAGLRIVEEAERLEGVAGAPLRLRVGINTGEALVRLGVAPASGEGFLTGDAINTASRIQSVAPEMGVAVGQATYEATELVFDYQELEAAMLKGKADPVRVFHATAPRARFGTDLTRTHDSPFVGREIDLAILKGVFDKTVAASSVQLVTVVGEPGLGKSRIVAELGEYVDTRPDLVTWRQGRCLPYGEGITFWALGEILKAHTGILESDSPEVARAKLDRVLPEGSEREWFRQRLLPLLGIEATSPAEREELFTAWRRFLEQVAEERPTVLVFEDLHWADPAMLAFLEHLADVAEGVPLLLVTTARPELYEHHPDYARGLRNATALNLAPLSQEETARLVSALLDATVLPVEVQRPILDRADGNPLYAEEFVRLLKDRDLLVRAGSSWELKAGAEVPFPDSVQALIAARLDTLEPEAKSLLADAAVIGKVFWAGGVAQMGERDLQTVTGTLRELSRKELVRPARQSSMAGEAEYAFGHILARDVAYNQLPRASRASRHVAAAAWIESKVPGRVEDLADVLAYHYATAFELARAAGESERASRLEAPALRFLGLAAERALGLDTAAALASSEHALALVPAGHPDRAVALARFGAAAFHAGRLADAAEALDEAVALFRARGDVLAAARAMGFLGEVLYRTGDPRWADLPAEAVALLEPLPAGSELVSALTELARADVLQGRGEAAIRHAEQALALAGELGLPRAARTLGYRGLARCDLGDAAGLDDFRDAIALATEAGQGREAGLMYANFGETLWAFQGAVAALEVMRSGIAFAQDRGLAETVSYITGSTLDPLFGHGSFDEALAVAAAIVDRSENADITAQVNARAVQARILSLRGHAPQVAASLDWLESTAAGAGAPDYAVIGLASAALARAALEHDAAAATLLGAILATPGARDVQYYAIYLPTMVRTAVSLGDRSLAERLVDACKFHHPIAAHAGVTVSAALAETRGDHEAAAEAYAEGAERWQRFGVAPEHAFALLGQGRCLTALGQPAEATGVLRRARNIFEALEAAPALAETDGLLRQLDALSA